MVSYQDRQGEMKHNFRSLYKSLNHDENVLNEYITPKINTFSSSGQPNSIYSEFK